MGTEELLCLAKMGDKAAKEELFLQYRPLLISRSMIEGRFCEDLFQEYEHNPVFNVFCSYEETNKKIEVRKAESFEYLKKALKNVDAKSKQNVYSICPYKQSVSDNCIGKTIDSIENNNTNNPFIEHINKVIRNNGICLMDKCYGCRRLRYNMGDYVFQCPLYINHLKKEIKEGKWLRVYLSYCLYYDLKKLIKKRNARG